MDKQELIETLAALIASDTEAALSYADDERRSKAVARLQAYELVARALALQPEIEAEARVMLLQA